MESSRLLNLPTELRLQILESVLSSEAYISIGGCYSPSFFQKAVPPAIFDRLNQKSDQVDSAGILLVNRQIRKEAQAIFYRQNHFFLALHYKRARNDCTRFLDAAATNPTIADNLWQVTIKHRFGILDFRGTIDFDLKNFEILGPHLWYNSIPPIYIRQIEEIIADARRKREICTNGLILNTLRQLVDVLGVIVD